MVLWFIIKDNREFVVANRKANGKSAKRKSLRNKVIPKLLKIPQANCTEKKRLKWNLEKFVRDIHTKQMDV